MQRHSATAPPKMPNMSRQCPEHTEHIEPIHIRNCGLRGPRTVRSSQHLRLVVVGEIHTIQGTSGVGSSGASTTAVQSSRVTARSCERILGVEEARAASRRNDIRVLDSRWLHSLRGRSGAQGLRSLHRTEPVCRGRGSERPTAELPRHSWTRHGVQEPAPYCSAAHSASHEPLVCSARSRTNFGPARTKTSTRWLYGFRALRRFLSRRRCRRASRLCGSRRQAGRHGKRVAT